jgi:hypothetical protein
MTVTLDGSDYLFEFRFNQREGRWYFDVALTDGTVLVRGIKVVCNTDLLKRFGDTRLPPGKLVAFANTSSREAPGQLELGEDKRVTLLYFDAAEVAEATP